MPWLKSFSENSTSVSVLSFTAISKAVWLRSASPVSMGLRSTLSVFESISFGWLMWVAITISDWWSRILSMKLSVILMGSTVGIRVCNGMRFTWGKLASLSIRLNRISYRRIRGSPSDRIISLRVLSKRIASKVLWREALSRGSCGKWLRNQYRQFIAQVAVGTSRALPLYFWSNTLFAWLSGQSYNGSFRNSSSVSLSW